jgi:hypothetical protein
MWRGILKTFWILDRSKHGLYFEMPTRRLTYKESVAYWILPLFLLMWLHGQKGYNLRLSLSYIHLWFGGEEAFVWSIIYIEEHIRCFYPIVLLISNEIFDIYTRLYQVNNVLTMTQWHYMSSRFQRVWGHINFYPGALYILQNRGIFLQVQVR